MRALPALFAAITLVPGLAAAQSAEPIISTDRPSFSTGTSIAPARHGVLESGFTVSGSDSDPDDHRRLTLPELTLRWGLIEDRLEAQASWTGWSRDEAGSVTERGITDVTVGLKWRLTEQAGRMPRLVLVPLTTLGVGDAGFSSQQPDPALRLAWSYGLAGGMTVGGNANLAWISDEYGRVTQAQGSIYGAWAATERTSFFAEYYLLGPVERDGGSADAVDAGVLHLLNRRVQADFRIGAGLDRELDDFTLGAGLSFLF